jgi:hypothetical protein
MSNDSVLTAEQGSTGGISLGLLATGRLSDHFQFRFNPTLFLGGSRYFSYTLASTQPNKAKEQKQILPTTIVSMPVHFKFNSDRIDNFRTYLLFDVKFDTDLLSNSALRNVPDIIKLRKNDFGLEGGLGFNFFLPFVTISPVIKFSYGLTNLLIPDPNLKYASVYQQLQSRMIVFSSHFEN